MGRALVKQRPSQNENQLFNRAKKNRGLAKVRNEEVQHCDQINQAKNKKISVKVLNKSQDSSGYSAL